MVAQEEYQVAQDTTIPLAQLSHVLLDVDFFDNPKIEALEYRFGPLASLWLIRCYCKMSRGSHAVVPQDTIYACAKRIGVDEDQANAWIEYCLKYGLIIEKLNGYSNTRVIEDQQKLGLRRIRETERKKLSRGRPQVVTRLSRGTDAGQTRDPVTDTDTEYIDRSISDDHNTTVDRGESEGGELDEDLALAGRKLETPKSQEWTRRNPYMLAGRQPMRDYPLISISKHELASVIRDWKQRGIPPPKWRKAFLACEARLRTYLANGKSLDHVAVVTWLLGFQGSQLVDETTQDERLARQKNR